MTIQDFISLIYGDLIAVIGTIVVITAAAAVIIAIVEKVKYTHQIQALNGKFKKAKQNALKNVSTEGNENEDRKSVV